MARGSIKLEEAVERYIFHMRGVGIEPSTIQTYTSGLKALVASVGNVETYTLSGRHLDVTFASRKWSAATRNARLSQYKAFFAWCRATGCMKADQNPAFGWGNRRVPSIERQRIPQAEWSRLFNACIHPQETIALATGLYLFLRASEQRMIQLKHLRLDTSEIAIHRVKTKEVDVMPLPAELLPYLRKHLTMMTEQGFNSPEHYLIGQRGNMGKNAGKKFVLGSGTLDHTKPFAKPHVVIKRILTRAGYPDFGEGEHTLRRSGARAYFDALIADGYDGALKEVQSMLGHANSTMTERYLGLSLDRKKRNERLAGRPMFPQVQSANVVPIRKGM